MSKQLDYNGLVVRSRPDACRACSAVRATMHAGAGPHIASLHCVYCGVRRGWISRETYSFITETIRLAGRPTRPIIIRRGHCGG
jgi:hypothetical protein